MSQHPNCIRLQLDALEGRSLPSAYFGDHWNHGHHSHAPEMAHVAHARHGGPIEMSTRITSDGTGELKLSGFATYLGRFTGKGIVEHFENTGGQVTASGTVTFQAANGDRLFGTFSVSLNTADGHGSESVTFTGGTGRFAGATGALSQTCETTWDPTNPLIFECKAEGSGNLYFDHSQVDGKHEKVPEGKHEKVPEEKQGK